MKIKNEVPELTDQSVFFEEQPLVQAPPNEIARQDYIRQNKQLLKKKQTKMLLLFLGIVLVLSAVLAIVFDEPEPEPVVETTPTPTLEPIDPTALGQELLRLEEAVIEADPVAKPLDPPPVDMDVGF